MPPVSSIGDPLVDFAVTAVLTLLVVVDPIGLLPAYVGLVAGRPPAARANVAGRAVVIAGLVLLGFAVLGGPLLAYLGIGLGALQAAGGLLLFRIAVDMVFVQLRRETAEEAAEAQARDDISVFPLAIPLIAGPGAFATVLILASRAAGDAGRFVVLFLAGVVVLGSAYLLLRTSGRVAKLLGRTGINVVTRILGLLLAALAVQYVADGLLAMAVAAP